MLIPGPGYDADMGQRQDLFRRTPGRKFRPLIGADQQPQLGVRMLPAQVAQCFHRVGRPRLLELPGIAR